MLSYHLNQIVVTSPAGLGELESLIHDEAFEVAEVSFDSNIGVVTIPFRRIFHGGPERLIWKSIFSRRREVEVLRAVIRVLHVTQARFSDTEKIGTYTFEAVRFEPATSEWVFQACPKMELRLQVSNMEIECQETHFDGKAIITDILFWQTSKFVGVYPPRDAQVTS